jgi:S1-C subfamily serine protease
MKATRIFAQLGITAALFLFNLHPLAAQLAPSRKDIPTIAKSAKGAIVTIVMANDDKPIAQGTGFLVTADGAVVTNYHVIAMGNVALVKFADGSISPVDGVLTSNKVRDLAIIKIHSKTLPILTLGNSDQMQIGEEVVAIGNPLGLELTVSNGILSGVRTDEKAGGKFLQITAPITHGSSGGPLFNMMGEVVGITTLGFEGSGNLNFAIPINDAKRLLSNRSSKLQNLPNEPAPVEAKKAGQGRPATMEQQKLCAGQAEQVFLDHFPDGRDVDGGLASYTSHYDTRRGICFVETVGRRSSLHRDAIFWAFSKEIDDAFVGKRHAYLGTVTVSATGGDTPISPADKPRITDCVIALPPKSISFSHDAGIQCHSEKEFDALALKYFGITP